MHSPGLRRPGLLRVLANGAEMGPDCLVTGGIARETMGRRCRQEPGKPGGSGTQRYWRGRAETAALELKNRWALRPVWVRIPPSVPRTINVYGGSWMFSSVECGALSAERVNSWRQTGVKLVLCDNAALLSAALETLNCKHFAFYIVGARESYADESDTLLRDVLHNPGDALRYVYDFGDYWVRRVELAAIRAAPRRPAHAGTAAKSAFSGGTPPAHDMCLPFLPWRARKRHVPDVGRTETEPSPVSTMIMSSIGTPTYGGGARTPGSNWQAAEGNRGPLLRRRRCSDRPPQ